MAILFIALLWLYVCGHGSAIDPVALEHQQEMQKMLENEIIQGKKEVGEWGNLLMCLHGVRVAGFRLKVSELGLTGIQLACADGTVTHESIGDEGTWTEYQYCEGEIKLFASKHAHEFNYMSDTTAGGQNVVMKCNEGTVLMGKGKSSGAWDSAQDAECPESTYFCGVQRRGDDTAMTQIKWLCCKPKKEIIITESTIMGKTSWGHWSEIIMCENEGQMSGFRLKVEDPQGSGDDTGLNGIQLFCKDGTASKKIEGPFGEWKPWQFCDTQTSYAMYQYVTGFNFKSQKKQYDGDDTAGSNVQMICRNKRILDGQGSDFGTWDSNTFKVCPYESFPCGVQARIEENQGKGDDTGLNQIKFICCKIENEKCPIDVEPLGCYGDYRDEAKRTMPNELLNERDPSNPHFDGKHFIDWYNYPVYLPAFRCRCAVKAAAAGYKVFGIQYYAECWSGPDAQDTYDKYGEAKGCVDTKYQEVNHDMQACPVQTGVGNSNFAYRISSVDSSCSLGYAPIGCFEDNMDIPRPVPNYDHNERDDSIPGWNGIYIDWKNWNNYYKKMICRCAEAAKRRNHDIFSIQFWGECWTAFHNETEYDRDGPSTRCRGKDFKPCPCNSFHCVGMQQANFVYRIVTF